jgi:four helix bundle protein
MQSEKGYHRLIICTKARELIKAIYVLTEKFPRSELLGLTSQIRRAAISVLLNIVEGQRRNSQKDFLRFLDTADASLAEVEACLEVAMDLGYISSAELEKIEEKRREVAIMLVSLIKAVKKSL